MPPKTRPVNDRFWEKVSKTDSCWIWTAAKDKDGYGLFKRSRNLMVRAHRFVFSIYGIRIPMGMHVDHTCRNPSCVMLNHLEAVTPRENVRRGRAVRRGDFCKYGHEYTKDNIVIRSENGRRRCRKCARIADSRSYYKHKGIKK